MVQSVTTSLLSALEERLEQPTSRGLAHAVSAAVRDGVLVPGDRLPPIRTVAAQLALSPTTVSAAWGLLARSGTVMTDGRRGTTVLDQARPAGGRYRQAVEHPSAFTLDLSTGVPDPHLLPDLGAVLARTSPTAATGSYLDPPVLPALADVLARTWPYPSEHLSVVDGAMDALDLVVRTHLRFGDRVVVEDPGFPPLIDLLESVGARLVGVPLDDEGMDVDALARALQEPTAAVVLQPRAQNPTGVTTTRRRGQALADLLRGSDALVVEDDSADGLSDAPLVSLGAWLPEQTVHVRSFSKSHGPDLRLAAMTAPGALHHAVQARRRLGQGWSSRLLQQVLLTLLTEASAVEQVTAAGRAYAARRAAVVTGLAARGVEVAGTEGLNVWVPVQDETAAVVRLASQGIGVAPGSPFRLRPDADGGHVRVTVGLVREGAEHVAEAVADAARAMAWTTRAR
jgi:DNA-binding transcriptional MocR family regulator